MVVYIVFGKIKMEKERRKIWFISDTHFTHPSILYFHPWRRDACGVTLEELQEDKNAALEKHDKWLIDKWNSTIKKCDEVYILGDFCLGNRVKSEEILKQLKGRKHLITGNHDKSLKGLENYFESVSQIKEVKFTNNQFKFIDPEETFCVELCHFPMLTWNRRPHGTCHVHGHCHGGIDAWNKESKELRVDAGLDSDIFGHEFIEVEALYEYFKDIRDASGCKKFEEYQEWLMANQGFRM